MKRALHILVVVAAACLGMTACGDSSCYDNGNSLPLATFYLDGKQLTDVVTKYQRRNERAFG